MADIGIWNDMDTILVNGVKLHQLKKLGGPLCMEYLPTRCYMMLHVRNIEYWMGLINQSHMLPPMGFYLCM
jgi:hypothetical protein